jgi:hypothetical protein
MAMGCAYKISDGTETGTFTVASSISGRSAMFLMSVKNWHGSTIPEAAFSAETATTAQDPPNLDPAGWGAEDTLWIAVAAGGETSLTGTWTGIASAPASYTNFAASSIAGGDVIGACQIAVAFRGNNVSAENPGSFTTDTSPEIERAATIAVRPVVVTNANAENAAATATSQDAQADVGVNAEASSATATAQDATVTTGASGTDAPAGEVTVAAAAQDATADIGANAQVAAATATAQDAATALTANAEAAAAAAAAESVQADIGTNAQAVTLTAAALDAGIAVEANAECATASALAQDPTISTGGNTNANAENASATAAAQDPVAALEAAVEAALAAAGAGDAWVDLSILAEVAAAAATAYDAEAAEPARGVGPPTVTSTRGARARTATPVMSRTSATTQTLIGSQTGGLA